MGHCLDQLLPQKDRAVTTLVCGSVLQSFKAVQGGLMVNLDTSAAAFVQARPLPELLMEVKGVSVVTIL